MRPTVMKGSRAAIASALMLALLLGSTTVGEAKGRGGGGRGGGSGFHGGHGGGFRGGVQGRHGGRFHGHHSGFHHRGFHHHSGFGRHHGFRGKAFIGVAPFFAAPFVWWGPSVAYSSPPVYVNPGSNGYWYYCQSARAYYPYVPTCPEAWVPVLPH
jgi:hypothetical protein